MENIIGKKEVLYMADVYDGSREMYDKLRKGEPVLCYKCKKSVLLPFNTTADKAHDFNCSDENCDGHIHFVPGINIE